MSDGRIFTQDLTPLLVRDWLDEACIDAVLDEDDDVFVSLDGTRMCVQLIPAAGAVFMWLGIDCEDCTDRAALLKAVNDINDDAIFVRAIASGAEGEWRVRYEHHHFGLEGIISRRQLVKLVRRFKVEARAAHAELCERVEG